MTQLILKRNFLNSENDQDKQLWGTKSLNSFQMFNTCEKIETFYSPQLWFK